MKINEILMVAATSVYVCTAILLGVNIAFNTDNWTQKKKLTIIYLSNFVSIIISLLLCT